MLWYTFFMTSSSCFCHYSLSFALNHLMNGDHMRVNQSNTQYNKCCYVVPLKLKAVFDLPLSGISSIFCLLFLVCY